MIGKLKERLASGDPTVGMWITLESPTISEIAASVGLDWIVVDLEHGHLDFAELIEHCRAVRGSDTSVLVRVPEIAQGVIKRVLDIGVEGVLLPLVRDEQDVEAGVRYAKYPPRGVRGIGGERAVSWGLDESYVAAANKHTAVIPLIETVEAVKSIDQILEVEGVDGIFFGPADLSASAGYPTEWEGPGVAEMIVDVCGRAAERGLPAGIIGRSSEDRKLRLDQGFRMIGLGSDAGMVIEELRRTLFDLLGRDFRHNWF